MSRLVTFLASTNEVNPIAIIGIVVFFGGIIALSLWQTKSAAKKGAKKIRNKYGDRIMEEGTFSKSVHWFITKDELLAQKYYEVFAVYRLSDIRFIGIRWDAVLSQNVLFMTDAEGKRVKPSEVIGGTKAARKLYGNSAISLDKDSIQKVCDAIFKYAPNAQYESN